jgi:hypothetical protein
MEESIDQLKKQHAIQLFEIGIGTLQKVQESPIVVATFIQFHDALVLEYNELYAPKVEPEDEKTRPTLLPPKKGEKPSVKMD